MNVELISMLRAHLGNPLSPDLAADICIAANAMERLAKAGALERIRPAKHEDFVFALERIEDITDEIRQARAAVSGPFSFMKGKLPRYLGLDEHLELGVNIAWYPGFTHHIAWAALWDFMQAFEARGIAAWEDFVASRKERPYPIPEVGPDDERLDKQRELEELYLSGAMLEKYRR